MLILLLLLFPRSNEVVMSVSLISELPTLRPDNGPQPVVFGGTATDTPALEMTRTNLWSFGWTQLRGAENW